MNKNPDQNASTSWADDEVRSFDDWCRTANLSPATGRRLVKAGKGPVITCISDRRIGITGRNHRVWLDQRASKTDGVASLPKFSPTSDTKQGA